MEQSYPNLIPALPELWLALGALVLLMLGVFRTNHVRRTVNNAAALMLAVAFFLVFAVGPTHQVTFSGLFVSDGFTLFMKALVLLGSGAVLVMSKPYLVDKDIFRFEYPVLVVTATLGMLMMVSANDMLSLYLGLELQSLSLYVLAAFNRDRQRSTEAGLKYFVLGALSSGMLLYGISLIYGFSGTTNFTILAGLYSGGATPSVGVLVGLVFVLAGLAFKISAAPFHMWTPDVYEGAPTPVTAFFAAAPKIAAMALVVRLLMGTFQGLVADWQQLVVFLSIASMVVGAFLALVQTNIKRLMAYSSIGHVGFALVGLAAGTTEGVTSLLVYMAIYLSMTLGAFACILSMRHKEGMCEDISDLAGLAKNQPRMAAALAIFMFSLAGIPLLAGFFGKLLVFLAAISAGLYTLALIGVLASVVGAFYYLRIVKIMYFDEPADAFEAPESRSIGLVMGVTAALNSPLSFFLISPLVAWAGAAAGALVL
ncbi:MAG: NADH-quinone oxidoreductase subunit NuoN [Proteobacteria bacterium]|nr:NADH-quinone oxidoreductase subunit NuoN [Pseudomonadota bacterium]